MGPDGNAGFDATEPDVAYGSTPNEYLVVWQGDDDTAPLVNEEFEIFGRRSGAGAPLPGPQPPSQPEPAPGSSAPPPSGTVRKEASRPPRGWLRLGGRRRQNVLRNGKVALAMRCRFRCTVLVRTRLSIVRRGRRRKVVELPAAHFRLAPGVRRLVVIRLPRWLVSHLRRPRWRTRLTAVLALTRTDRTGLSMTREVAVRR
jgi:hypothetical protein